MTTARTRTARSIRVVPALFLAVAVLLVAVAGTATAAKLITGKQIKNSSITSADVRNNNLTGADLKNGNVTGADLKNGSVGRADLAPDSVGADQLDPDTLTYAYTVTRDDIDVSNCPDQTLAICPSLVTLLGTGSKAVTVSGTLENVAATVPTPTICGLVYNNVVLSTARFAPNKDGLPGYLVPFTLQAVVDVDPATTLQLRCTQFAGDDLHLVDVKLQSVSVTIPSF